MANALLDEDIRFLKLIGAWNADIAEWSILERLRVLIYFIREFRAGECRMRSKNY